MATVTLLGIDIGKNTFHLHGQDARGHQVLRKKLNRSQLLPYLAQISTCKIAMESCGGSQWLARKIKEQGHHVQLIAPQHVKAYVTGNKNDFIDAEAICEAASRPRTRSVQVKTVEQQVLCTEHRLRKSLVSRRTAVINQVHGFLLEFGVIFPAGYAALDRVSGLMQSRELPIRLINAIERMLEDIRQLTGEIKRLDVEIKQSLVQSDAGQRLQSIPGIGPLIASALVADVGDASVFKSSRDFAASLGLVPRQYSTGGETVLLGISKRGDKYLRSLLVQGAHTVLYRVDHRTDALGRWAKNLLVRKPLNKVACALANKMARIIWVLLTKGGTYNSQLLA
ncbi:transposase IS111A/IS1328/IS1533 [Pseudomonas sp. GM41(2012)]|uniref:IS110 family transposase n=1 Tax=Pseudomonas sp. (strain GM41(2012)) TaxID=1144708 RepID=UPI00026FD732|nr:IS110 family transposase [Pseudomonas sp. GM41(2012)]EUB75713.1 transposase IS111A/IS1328/IS1533 [Pseudomonas sp. GM41(2012)]